MQVSRFISFVMSVITTIKRSLESLTLCVILLFAAIVLIFSATLDQVHLGVWAVQEKYIKSLIVYRSIPELKFDLPVFPGGYLIGSLLLLNIIFIHSKRFAFSLKNLGLTLTHLGLLLLIISLGLSSILEKDYEMHLSRGVPKNYSENNTHLAFSLTEIKSDREVVIFSTPTDELSHKTLISPSNSPLRVKVLSYYPNAVLLPTSSFPSDITNPATEGYGISLIAKPIPIDSTSISANHPALIVQIINPSGSITTYLVSSAVNESESFNYRDHKFNISLSPERDALPFDMTLTSFTHTDYFGTHIPKVITSHLRISEPLHSIQRDVTLTMNSPLRLAGRTFYQAGYENNDQTSIIKVVKNPTWQLPYLSCALMTVGLLLHFIYQLILVVKLRSYHPHVRST